MIFAKKSKNLLTCRQKRDIIFARNEKSNDTRKSPHMCPSLLSRTLLSNFPTWRIQIHSGRTRLKTNTHRRSKWSPRSQVSHLSSDSVSIHTHPLRHSHSSKSKREKRQRCSRHKQKSTWTISRLSRTVTTSQRERQSIRRNISPSVRLAIRKARNRTSSEIKFKNSILERQAGPSSRLPREDEKMDPSQLMSKPQ